MKNKQLEKYAGFKHELAIAETYEEIKLLEDKAAAVSEFIKRDGLGKKEQDEWGEFRMEIAAKKGAWLDEFFPSKSRKFAGHQKEPAKMPVTKKESSRARTINREPEFVKEAIEHLKKDPRKVVTPSAVHNIVDKKKQLEKEKDPEYLEEKEKERISRYFADTSKELTKALDCVTYIIQGDYLPQKKTDGEHITAINHNLYRAIRLAIQAGIDVPKVWETYHNKVKITKHLKIDEAEIIKDSIEEAEIIN